MQEEHIIDLTATDALNEGYLGGIGMGIELALRSMFGTSSVPVKVRGTKAQVDAFIRALRGEKRYIDAINRHGLNNKSTLDNRSKLDTAIKGFERETGIPWPIKN